MAKILLVEDAVEVAQMFSLLLTMHNHEVDIALSSEEALQKMNFFKPNLIILDVWLGGENGKELCKKIRSSGNDLPIMLMSANAELLKDYEDCQANDIIEKPFDIAEVMVKVNRLI